MHAAIDKLQTSLGVPRVATARQRGVQTPTSELLFFCQQSGTSVGGLVYVQQLSPWIDFFTGWTWTADFRINFIISGDQGRTHKPKGATTPPTHTRPAEMASFPSETTVITLKFPIAHGYNQDSNASRNWYTQGRKGCWTCFPAERVWVWAFPDRVQRTLLLHNAVRPEPRDVWYTLE